MAIICFVLSAFFLFVWWFSYEPAEEEIIDSNLKPAAKINPSAIEKLLYPKSGI